MNITKSRKDLVITVCVGVLTGVVGDAIWDGLKHFASTHPGISPPHVNLQAISQLFFFVLIALAGVFIGRHLEHLKTIPPINTLLPPKIRQSRTFVLEVEGKQPLDSKNSDWRFFLTNCTTRILRRVELYNIKSEIGAYLLGFKEIPVMQPGQKIALSHKVFPQRLHEKYSPKEPTLWDFARDVAGETATTFFWYDIYIECQEADSDKTCDGGFVGVCFDLHDKKLKTEYAEYYRKDRQP
jgi:hypothetical protein